MTVAYRAFAALWLASTLVPMPAPAAPSDSGQALRRCLEQRAAREDFSGVVMVTRRGRPLAWIARGQKGGAGSGAIDSESRFNIGSASKMFTAVAVGQLIDSGKVRLDDSIGRFVPGLTPEASAVTVRQLLTHSSGLGNFFSPENMAAMLKARTAADLLPLVAGERPSFPPGSRFAYSNSGFALLGVMIERVSGRSYGDYLDHFVFAPAGMRRTGLDPAPLSTLAIAMTARRPGGGPDPSAPAEGPAPLGPAPAATEAYGSPAGGLFSTAGDMERFARALLSNRLTRPATTWALTAPQIVAAPAGPDRPELHYGFGFGAGSVNGRTWFGHNGGTLGANGEFAVFPKEGLTLTVLANRDPPMATRLFAYVRDLALDPASRAGC